METSDIPRVAEIIVFGWRSAFRSIVSDEFLFNERTVVNGIARLEQLWHNEVGGNYVFDDGIVKAIIRILPCRDEDKPNSLELGVLYVDVFFQKQGIGKLLIEFFEQQAAECGYNELCIWTFLKNATARAFYEKMGYAHDGTVNSSGEFYERHKATGVRYTKRLRGVLK